MNRQQRRAGAKAQRSTKKLDPKFQLGVLTVAQEGDGWIVLEDGRRVGGTLCEPFASRADALRWVKLERAGYEKHLALGNFKAIARAQFIRQTDPETWARAKEIMDQFAGEESAEHRQAHAKEIVDQFAGEESAEHRQAHRDAGTHLWLIKYILVGLEAEGVVTAPDARGAVRLTEFGRRREDARDAVKTRTQALLADDDDDDEDRSRSTDDN
jgi:hypothetical protein